MSMGFVDNFEKKMKQMETQKIAALTVVGIYLKGEYIARLGAHVVTGNLIASPEYRVDGSVLKVGSPVEYAGFLEYGTSKSPAHPTLRPAIDDNKDRINELLASQIRKAL